MRQPVVAVTSCLLSLVVVLTTLFATKPPVFLKPASTGYDFTYAYHQPTKTGGTITVGLASAMISLAPAGISSLQVQNDQYLGLWQSCLVQLPDLSLGLSGWKADQCSEVPTVANGDESPDFKTTILRIDPRAVWSDGVPITADDFLFAFRLYADPTIYGVPMTATALNEHTVQITWPTPTVDYLDVLAPLSPLPLHAYATGAFAGVYGPTTGAYNAKLAQQLIIDPSFTRKISVDNGPFTLQRIVTKQVNPFNHKKLITVITSATVIKNPHFFSNFFHTPALDQVTFESAWEDFGDNVTRKQWQDDMVARYRQGGLEEVESLDSLNLKELSGIPAGEVITSPLDSWFDMGFNQRNVAPNAQANDGTSMFTDKSVRQAFIEAFDRCSAMRALLAIKNCSDPNLFSDELTAPPAVDFDPTFHLPSYNPTDAADLLDRAGYPVIDGIRRGKDKKTPLQLQLTLSFSALDMKDLAVRMTQDYAKNLQISVTVLDMDNNVAQAVAPQGAFDLAIWADGGFPSDPIGIVLGEGGGWDAADIPSAQNPNGSNIYGLIDPYVVARDQLGSHIQDGGQRAEVYEQLQRYVSEQFDFQPILLLSDVTLTKTTLCNFKKSSVSNNTWNMADWYVAPSCP
jgi:ABC-type transport system substrate-binding protein